MREFPLSLASYFKNGLRQDYRVERNRPGLAQVKNLQPSPFGLVAYEPLQLVADEASLLLHQLNLQWPFPALHHGKQFSLLFARDALFFLHPQTSNIIRLDTYDFYDQEEFAIIEPGIVWSIADMGNMWIAANGSCLLFHNNLDLVKTELDKIYVAYPALTTDRIPLPVTTCAFKGRYILGGFVNRFLNADMRSMLTTDAKLSTKGLVTEENIIDSFAENTIWWSSVGGGDLLTLLKHSYAASGYVGATGYNTSQFKYAYDLWRKNEAGFAMMKWQSFVRYLVESKEFAVAYGDNGVTGLFAVLEPMSTLGTREIANFGLLCSGAAASNGDDQIFLDQEGELWLIDGKMNLIKLGYKEYFRDMIGSDVVIRYESSRKRFFIGNGYKQFALGKEGLYETTQLVTSIAFIGRPVCIGANPNLVDRSWNVLTDTFDMANRQTKNVGFVELTGDIDNATQGRVHYRFASNAQWQQGEWSYVYDNHFNANVAGIEFRLEIKGSDFSDIRIESANVRWQQSDKRFVRGAYQTQAAITDANQ